MPPLVIYHANCIDGFGAAFAAWSRFGADAEYCPAQHGQYSTLQDLEKLLPPYAGRDVYILDFSFPMPLMHELMSKARMLVWLDHHASSFDAWCGVGYLGQQVSYRMVRSAPPGRPGSVIVDLDDTRAGALMAWEYFHPQQPIPRLYAYIDDYDRGAYALPGSKEFNLALNARQPWTVDGWAEFLTLFGDHEGALTPQFQDMLTEGHALARMQAAHVRALVAEARPCRLPGAELTGWAVTCPLLFVNDVGELLVKNGCAYAICWYVKADGSVKVSLRSNGAVNVKDIAEANGGGGHVHSAAFNASLIQLQSWLTTKGV